MKRKQASLDQYYVELKDRTPLTPEELTDAVHLARAGDTAAFDLIVESNLRFVVSTAARFPNRQLPLEDLISEGNLGLIEAARRFDPDLGYRFTTYAIYWIRRAMQKAVLLCGHACRQPTNRIQDLIGVRGVQRILQGELGREATIEEIAEVLRYTSDRVLSALAFASPDLQYDGDDPDSWYPSEKLPDNADTPDIIFERIEAVERVQRALNSLKKRERLIITENFGLNGEEPASLSAIGRRLGLSRERVRQLRDKGLQNLRAVLGDDLMSRNVLDQFRPESELTDTRVADVDTA